MSPANINNLIMQNSYIVILAVGMLLCVLTGNIDLGVGSIVAVCGAAVGIMIVDYKASMWVAILAALAIGTLSGMFVGFFVSKLSIPPFIVTLATMLMGRGLTYTLLKAQTKGPLPTNYTYIGAGFLPTVKIPFGTGTLDMVSIGVALAAFALIIFSEIKSIRTKKKYGFPVNPLWQSVLKVGVILVIVWFFFYKLSRYNGIPFVLVIMGVLVASIISLQAELWQGGRFTLWAAMQKLRSFPASIRERFFSGYIPIWESCAPSPESFSPPETLPQLRKREISLRWMPSPPAILEELRPPVVWARLSEPLSAHLSWVF